MWTFRICPSSSCSTTVPFLRLWHKLITKPSTGTSDLRNDQHQEFKKKRLHKVQSLKIHVSLSSCLRSLDQSVFAWATLNTNVDKSGGVSYFSISTWSPACPWCPDCLMGWVSAGRSSIFHEPQPKTNRHSTTAASAVSEVPPDPWRPWETTSASEYMLHVIITQ